MEWRMKNSRNEDLPELDHENNKTQESNSDKFYNNYKIWYSYFLTVLWSINENNILAN